MLSELKGRDSRGVRDWDDNVRHQASRLELLLGGLGEVLSHSHTSPVDTNTVDGRVRSSKVDKLENVGGEGGRFANLSSGHSTSSDDDGLSGSDVLPVGEAGCLGDDALRCDEEVFSASSSGSSGHSDGSDAVRVSERDQSETSEHTDAGVCTGACSHEVSNGVENILFVDTELAGLLQVVGEDVEKELGVRIGVDMSVRVGVKELPERRRVDEVTILKVSVRRLLAKILTCAKTIPYGELT